ncbi:filamentous hemagglutinin N-terminal domain-containing protein [Tolypothrix campylonemoides VB511288]|nr:filamentous hemagglutinin N-terminal domain-containing protein [Tolypothrix campylonemoides VB511288]
MLSTNGWSWGWFLGLGIGIGGASFSSANCVLAQITRDGTLPNNSIININGNIFNITGGTQAGRNLFHSFNEFSVRTGQEAHFNNALDIQNIISRVTGSSVSDINGLIKVLGNTNLFLINPNGIVFGANASLDIKGSFVATTANSLKFADGTEFSAKAPQTTPLLTMSVPMGLQFGSGAKPIVNRSQASPNNKNSASPVGLQVPLGKTLALVGGDVTLEGGNLTAEQGRIELGSVGGAGLVSLTLIDKNNIDKGYALGYADVANFGDIKLTQKAVVDTSGPGGGTIQLQGSSVGLAGAAKIQANTVGASPTGGAVLIQASQLDAEGGSQISASTAGAGQGGSVTITAPNSVTLKSSTIDAFTQGARDAGYVRIDTGKLVVRDGAVRTLTQGNGRAGDVTVNASDSVELTSSVAQVVSGLITQSQGTSANGDSGNVTINTGKLIVQDGALITTSTAARGKGGNLTVVASDSVIVSGANSNGASVLRSSAGGTGAAGDISIDTRKLIVQGGGQISTSTFRNGRGGKLTVTARDTVELSGRSEARNTSSALLSQSQTDERGNVIQGNGIAGDITINTKRLIVRDGAGVSATSGSQGTGGKVFVNASESVELAGSVPARNGEPSRSGVFSQAVKNSGRAGDIYISTGKLTVRNGAIITVNDTNSTNNAQGAGNITITAPTIRLDNGQIVATTASGDGGNITLNNSDLLLLGGNSLISTSAGSPGRGGNGGNINISDPQYLVALPMQNSDITANSFQGNGGTVTIKAQGIIGLMPRSLEELKTLLQPSDFNKLNPAEQLPTNDVTAISLTGNPSLNGQVTINSPNTESSRELVNSPSPQVVDPSQIIAEGCGAYIGTGSSQFIITGRGGLPPNPNQPLSTDVVWSDTRIPNITAQQQPSQLAAVKPPSKQADAVRIVPATGWVFNGKGQVTLISSASTNNPHPSLQNSASCASR